MKLLAILFATFVFSSSAQAGVTLCQGKYALCAASTCQPTGKMISTNDGKTYPEVVCKCPILDGEAIADTSMGNMQGSCAPTDSEHVPARGEWVQQAPREDESRGTAM